MGRLGRAARAALAAAGLWAPAAHAGSPAPPEPVRAAYFYDYMSPGHLDSLAAAGFNRAVVRLVSDSVDAAQAARIETWARRGRRLGVRVVPDILFQSVARLRGLGGTRRYTWGAQRVEPHLPCPLDTAYWRSAVLDHFEEVFRAAPDLESVAMDLELYDAGRKHYDAGPCRCAPCLEEYLGPGARPDQVWRLSGLIGFQETRLTALLTRLLRRFAERHPGVELGVLDLDLDSFVHRALARALARARVPTVDYCERSYTTGGAALAGARARLDRLGHARTPLVGGLWLQRWRTDDLPRGVRSILERADGYFVFTTYSLWLDPSRLSGPYTLAGTPAEYWRVLQEVNRAP